MRDPQTILITGASSGIGAALAEAYARPGRLLALTGRDSRRLEACAARCQAAGAAVTATVLDICDRGAVAAWIAAVDARNPLDLVIANAGVAAGTSGAVDVTMESAEQMRRIFATNLDGVLNSVLPVLPGMRARGRGQIALMSSLAGFRGIPGASSYCAGKAAVRVLGEGLRGDLAAFGIEVSVICPGFIKTPMTDVNLFPMPFLMDVERAAALIVRGLAENRARIAFPWPVAAVAWLLAALPQAWTDRLVAGARRRKKR